VRICLVVDVEHALKTLDFLNGLEDFEEHRLIGAGFGALILAMVKAHGSLARARRHVIKEKEKLHEYFSMRETFTLEGVVKSILATLMKRVATKSASKLREHVKEVLKGVPVEGINVLVFDILAGEEKELTTNEENAFDVLAAALSFPPVYEPVKIEDSLYCNLTYMTGVPKSTSCDLLALGVCEEEDDTPKTAVSIMERADKLRTSAIMKKRLILHEKVVKLDSSKMKL